MTEVIKVIYDQPPMGFGKIKRVECPGMKFDDGQIAYLDQDKRIKSCENGNKLREALLNVVIEVQNGN